MSSKEPIPIFTSTKCMSFASIIGFYISSKNTLIDQNSLLDLNGKKTLIEKLHRPVYLNVDDLNFDGIDEFIVCNFGNKTGNLSLYEQIDGNLKKTIIHQQAGAIKCVVQDMNNDGKKDLVAMFSQGDESIYISFFKKKI